MFINNKLTVKLKKMLITVSFEDKLFSFEVEVSETIENVKALLEVETGIPIA